MNSRLAIFVRKWWYPLSIFPWFAAFMTPGLTLLSFMGFIFFSGVAARPTLENLISYATGEADEFNASAIPNTRKKSQRRKIRPSNSHSQNTQHPEF